MVTVDEFSRLVGGIYASASSPLHWEAALNDIRRALGGTVGTLCHRESGVWSIQATTASADMGKAYAERYCHLDYVLGDVESGPVGAVRTGTEVVLPNRNSEFYTGWMRPNDLDDGLFVRLSDGPTLCTLIVASPRRNESFDTPERVRLMGGLVVHLQQALRTQTQLMAAAEHSADVREALDIIRHGVIIVGSECRVISLNSSADALLRANDGLRTLSGRLGATNAHTEQELHRAIHTALLGAQSGIRAGQSLTCRRPSGKPAYVIHVVPLHSTQTVEEARGPKALVVVVDPHNQPDTGAAILRRLYRLTNGEAEVAVRIARGTSLTDIADELSVSYQTIRSHLQRVFEKTDTHRQGELVRLLLLLNP
jgi:DNA-binding CsgD family transcriptional regulator